MMTPEDDNSMGIEGHKAYMMGFEYAIDNGIVSPEEFAEEHEKEAIATLLPDASESSCKVKVKYDEVINKLLLSNHKFKCHQKSEKNMAISLLNLEKSVIFASDYYLIYKVTVLW